MSISVSFGINSSPVEKIGKDLSMGASHPCVLKDNTSVLRPTIVVNMSSDIYAYNYMYIEEFSRYYFIDDIVSLNNNVWEVSAHIDVLETYKSKILSNSAIIEGVEANSMINKYLPDNDVFITNCKHKTDIMQFPSGLSDTGEFILITAGG